MLEFPFTVPDLSQLRFAYSPIFELIASLRVLSNPARHALHKPWAAAARDKLAESGLADDPDFLLLREMVRTTGYIPDFLTPPANTPIPDLDEELALVSETTTTQLRGDLRAPTWPETRRLARDDLSPAIRKLYDRPHAVLPRVVTAMRRFADVAHTEHQTRIRAILDADVAYRSRRLARGGAAELFADLHPSVEWGDSVLRIHKKYCEVTDLDGRGLVLVPCVFAWPSVMAMTVKGWQPTLIYPARGIATLWETVRPAPRGLAGALGRTRADLIVALAGPASTGELATRLAVTPAAVSQHLTILRDAGLVTTDRQGRTAVHARTPVADALLSGVP